MHRMLPPARATRRLVAVLAALVTTLGLAVPAGATPTSSGRQSDAKRIARLVAKMSLAEKVGQLFVTYAYGDTATTTDPQYTSQNQTLYGVDNGAQLVSKYHLGGVIYFTWANGLTDPTKIAQLSNGLQTAATSASNGAPLLISTDQEGGNVVRISSPAAVSPGNMAIGATLNPLTAYNTSRATGQQLKAMGINVDDAPVVDTNTNPANAADGPRAFGDKALLTAAMGAASVLGYQGAGVASTAKHFPGLGSTSVNTDNGIAVSDETKAQFFANDIPAFRAAIAAGTGEIMAAHIVAPALDPSGAPASLSKPMVTGILRDQLHYNGVVVTDSLGAAALEAYPVPQRSVLAVEAGVDELLMPEDLAGSIAAVEAAVQSGAISEARLEQSVTRILTLKSHLGLFQNSQVDVSKVASTVGTSQQKATMASAAQHGMTLVRNTAHVLPLAANSGKSVLVTGWGATGTQTLATAMAARGVTTSRVYTGSAPSAAAIAASVAAAKQNDVTVVMTNNAWSDPGQVSLVQQLQATGKPIVVVAVGAPYELGYLPGTATFLASYGYQPVSLQAISDTVFGAQPTGHLPVTIRSSDGSTVVAPFGTGGRY